jgi:hypothetical protein
MHPRYNPEEDGSSEHTDCPGCESLRVIQLYVSIARKKAATGDGMIVSRAVQPSPAFGLGTEPAENAASPDSDNSEPPVSWSSE